MTSSQIRQAYLDFFHARGHAIISSASIVPENDSTLLFTNSGMSPLVPYLLGEKHPEGTRLVNSQKCLRSEDIEEVGDNRHNTFFEMLGNWSLGDYFKQEQLNWWYQFLIEEIKLDPNKLYQTVYAGDDRADKDEESIQILQAIFKKYKIDAEVGPETLGKGANGPGVELDFSKQRIFAYRDKNWWQRGEAIGELGGPDSETFYDTGKKHDKKFGEHCHLNCDCGRFLEIGNSVFMQYQKTENGWRELKNKNVDFGGGLERITMVAQGKSNIFETDLFLNILQKLENISGQKYSLDNSKVASNFEIIADHIKAVVFLIGDDKGVVPSNLDQGYIVRRLIRRALRWGKQLGIQKTTWLLEIAQLIINNYCEIYNELKKNEKRIIDEISKEEEKFGRTLENGLREFKRAIIGVSKINGVRVDKIKQINGVPIEKIKNFNNIPLKTKLAGKDAFNLFQTFGFPIELIKELCNEEKVEFNEIEFNEELKKHQELSRTSSVGKFKGGLADAGAETTKLHTAAHLMLADLRQVLGEHVEQRGSNITAERLRFDFSHSDKLTEEQKKEVERLVNEAIQMNAQVDCEEMSVEEAKKQGATGVFESRYGERVKVYTIHQGDKIFSKEICGGPHVKNTNAMGIFKIQKEESSSAGVRRIKAILS